MEEGACGRRAHEATGTALRLPSLIYPEGTAVAFYVEDLLFFFPFFIFFFFPSSSQFFPGLGTFRATCRWPLRVWGQAELRVRGRG